MNATTVFEMVPADGLRAVASMSFGPGPSRVAGPLCFDVFLTLAAARKWLARQFGVPGEAWYLKGGRISAKRRIVAGVVSWPRPARHAGRPESRKLR